MWASSKKVHNGHIFKTPQTRSKFNGMNPMNYRTQIIAIAEKIGTMRGFNPSDELARAIEDAGRSANAGDEELYQAAHRIMAHMNRERLLSGERAAI
jgi:pyruvate-formate lyase